MDSAGKLHVTYSGANIGNKPYYANNVSGSWVVKGVIDAGANCDGGSCRVARAPDDSLHVVYWDLNGNKLMYARSTDNGTTWSRAQKGNQDETGGCDIAVDQNGWVHLAYEYNNQLSYQRFCALPVTPPTSIVANPNPAWRGQDVTLTATGGSGGTIVWFEGGCGNGSPKGAGESIHVSAGSTTSYYARVESLCAVSACASGTLAVPLHRLPGSPQARTRHACAHQIARADFQTLESSQTQP